MEYGSDDQQRGKLQYSLEFNASTSEVIILFTDFKAVPPTGRKYNYIYIYEGNLYKYISIYYLFLTFIHLLHTSVHSNMLSIILQSKFVLLE